GVPLFIEELTRLVRQRGAGVGGRDGAAVREIPATLEDSLRARLDQLGPARDVAQVAAVIGREFSYALLQAVLPLRDPELQAALEALAGEELIYARGLPPEATYLFRHALVQDAAYAALLRSQRRDLHRAIARALAERFPAIAAEQPEVLAHHYTEAGEAEPAVAAWQRAGERAFGRGALSEAVSHLRRGLAVLATLPGRPPLLVVAHHAQAQSRFFAGDLAGAREHYGRALALYDEATQLPGPLDIRIRMLPSAAWTAWHLGHAGEARGYAREAVELAE